MPAGKKSDRIERFLSNLQKHPQHETLVPTLSSYKNTHSMVEFSCSKHDISFAVQGLVINLQRGGCPSCCEHSRSSRHREATQPRFIEKAIKVHGDKYDYSEVKYVNQYQKVKIICPIHGAFDQTPSDHIYCKCGCPVCKSSQGERAIGQFLQANNIQFEFQYYVKYNGNRHYFDFYLPDLNLIIEYDGKQHFEPIKWFGGEAALEGQQFRDLEKSQYCNENNIKLIRVPYTCTDIYDTLSSILSDRDDLEIPST